ncbi:MAG: hypothetical protein ACFFB0_01855 [Promethearchaeota archaeon]
MKKKLKMTIPLIATTFLITIFALVSSVNACPSNHILVIAKGDDLDIDATNLIIGRIKFGEGDEPPSVKAVFHQRIYDESGKKLYEMKGMLEDGLLLTTHYYFYCPVFEVYFINISWVMGEGMVKTTDTDYTVFFRNLFPITMPNTEGKYVSAQILMFLSPTAEYCDNDPGAIKPGSPGNPIKILELGAWALAAVIWEVETPMGLMELPVGPLSSLTKYLEI